MAKVFRHVTGKQELPVTERSWPTPIMRYWISRGRITAKIESTASLDSTKESCQVIIQITAKMRDG